MKRIVIFSDCTFSCVALHSIIRELYPDAKVKEAGDSVNLNDFNTIIFILNEGNVFQYGHYFINYYNDLPHHKIIIIGDGKVNIMFSAIVCCECKSIDINLTLKELSVKLDFFMIEKPLKQRIIRKETAISSSEIEVISMLSAGYSLSDIALLKKRSLKTISHYKCSFFRKLGLENRLATLLKITKGTNWAKA